MPHPFEIDPADLTAHIEQMVDVTFADIRSQFLLMPRGQNFVEFSSFQEAYEALKQETSAFEHFDDETVWRSLERNALAFVVVRTMLGISPPEWAELAKVERGVDVPQNIARQLDARCRSDAEYFTAELSTVAQPDRRVGFSGRRISLKGRPA